MGSLGFDSTCGFALTGSAGFVTFLGAAASGDAVAVGLGAVIDGNGGETAPVDGDTPKAIEEENH